MFLHSFHVFTLSDGAKSCSSRCRCSWTVNSRSDSTAASICQRHIDCRPVHYGNDKSRCCWHLPSCGWQMSRSPFATAEVSSTNFLPPKTFSAMGILCSGVSVHEWVRVCASRKPYLKNKFHWILVTDVFWFVDIPFRFWGQKVKDQGHSRQWPQNRWIQYLGNYWS